VDKLEIHFVVENFVSDQVLEGRDKKLIYLTLAWIDWARVCVKLKKWLRRGYGNFNRYCE
jgi:hypothetical protein